MICCSTQPRKGTFSYDINHFFTGTVVIMAIPLFEEVQRFTLRLPNSANFAFYFPWFLHAYLLILAIGKIILYLLSLAIGVGLNVYLCKY